MDFTKLLSLFLAYKYPIIFLTTIVEGPIIMTMSGLLVRLDLAGFWPIYFVLMAGDLVGDTVWYLVGYHFAHPLASKFGKFFGLTHEKIDKTKAIFQNHPKKILFLSKITMGFGLPLAALVVAGMSKISFKRYIASLFFGQIFFTGILISVGYFFGNLYEKINKDFQIISTFAFLVVVILTISGIRSYLKNRNILKN
ncbi:MAG: DedA family protein [Candidatus Paceibacterota bacterium]